MKTNKKSEKVINIDFVSNKHANRVCYFLVMNSHMDGDTFEAFQNGMKDLAKTFIMTYVKLATEPGPIFGQVAEGMEEFFDYVGIASDADFDDDSMYRISFGLLGWYENIKDEVESAA